MSEFDDSNKNLSIVINLKNLTKSIKLKIVKTNFKTDFLTFGAKKTFMYL